MHRTRAVFRDGRDVAAADDGQVRDGGGTMEDGGREFGGEGADVVFAVLVDSE